MLHVVFLLLNFSDHFCWRQTLWFAVFFAVPFCLLFFTSIIGHHPALHYFCGSEVYYWTQIRVLTDGDAVVKIRQFHIIFIQNFHLIFLHFSRGVMVRCLIAFHNEAHRTRLLDIFWIVFAKRTTIGSFILISFSLMVPMMWCSITFIYELFQP